jgi:hypothetical protein
LLSAWTCSVREHRFGPRGRSRDACTLRRLLPRRQPDRVTTISLPSCRLVPRHPRGDTGSTASRSTRAAPFPGFHQDRCLGHLASQRGDRHPISWMVPVACPGRSELRFLLHRGGVRHLRVRASVRDSPHPSVLPHHVVPPLTICTVDFRALLCRRIRWAARRFRLATPVVPSLGFVPLRGLSTPSADLPLSRSVDPASCLRHAGPEGSTRRPVASVRRCSVRSRCRGADASVGFFDVKERLTIWGRWSFRRIGRGHSFGPDIFRCLSLVVLPGYVEVFALFRTGIISCF